MLCVLAVITSIMWIRRILAYIIKLYKRGNTPNRKVMNSDDAPALIKRTKSLTSISSRRASLAINNEPQVKQTNGGE